MTEVGPLKANICDGKGCGFCAPFPVSPEDRFVQEQLDYTASLHPEATVQELRRMILQSWDHDLSEEQKSYYLEEYEDERRIWQEEHKTHHSIQVQSSNHFGATGSALAVIRDNVQSAFLQFKSAEGFYMDSDEKPHLMCLAQDKGHKKKTEAVDKLPPLKKKGKRVKEKKPVPKTIYFKQHGDHFTCQECHKTVKGKDKALKHIEMHMDEGFEYPCPKCTKVKKDRFSLLAHFRRDHGLAFEIAEMAQYKQTIAKGVYMEFAEKPRLKCLVQDKGSKKKTKAVDKLPPPKKKGKRMKQKKAVPETISNFDQCGDHYTCQECHKTVKGQDKALKHFERHEDEGFEYPCPKCTKVKIDRYVLLGHLRRDHGLAFEIAEMAQYKQTWTGAAPTGGPRPWSIPIP